MAKKKTFREGYRLIHLCVCVYIYLGEIYIQAKNNIYLDVPEWRKRKSLGNTI